MAQIREMGRSTQGVTLINLDEGEKLAGLEQHRARRDDENGNGNGRATATPARTATAHDDAPPSRTAPPDSD